MPRSRHVETETDPILTKEEAAKFLRVKPCTLDRWARCVEGPRYFRQTQWGRRFYLLSDLHAFVAEQRKKFEAA